MADRPISLENPSMPVPDGVPLPQRYWAILTIALGLTLAVLDGAIANVALPTIAHDVNASPSASIWVVNAYQLAVTISLLPLASLGEIYGYRRIYQGGLVVFTIASLCCALSSSLTTLTMARVIQGFGAAGIMSVNGALVRFIYPRRWIGRGVGLNATIGSIASALGPTVAAGILSVATWPWLFAVNIPLGLIAIPIALWHLPVTPTSGVKFDVGSAVLSALTFGLLITAIAGLGHGEGLGDVGAELFLVVGMIFVLVARQMARPRAAAADRPAAHPAVRTVGRHLGLRLRRPGDGAGRRCPSCSRTTLGFDAVETGLLMTPWPLTVAVIAPDLRPPGGPLPGRHPQRLRAGGDVRRTAGCWRCCRRTPRRSTSSGA